MQFFGGKFDFKGQAITRQNFDSFPKAFLNVFQILTLENWTDILYNCIRSDVNPFLSIFYLVSWIFIGNFIFLNLFLAILLDGFGSSDAMNMVGENEDEIVELDQMYQIKMEEEKRKVKNKKKIKKINDEITQKLIKSIEIANNEIDLKTYKTLKRVTDIHDYEEDEKQAENDEKLKATDDDELSVDNDNNLEKKDAAFHARYYQLHNIDCSFEAEEIAEFKRMLDPRKEKIKKRREPYKDVHCEYSCFIFSKTNKLRRLCANIGSHHSFESIVLTVIV